MIRFIGAAVVAAGLAFGACGSSEKKKDTGPAWTPAPDAEAIVGAWSDGAGSVTFDANGNYRWEKEIPCGKPPCPTTKTSGTYQLRSGKLYLDPQEGNDEVIEFTFGDQQGSVGLRAGSNTWNFKKN